MNNPSISVASLDVDKLGVANLGSMNNPSPSESRITNLSPSSADDPLPSPPSGQTSDHR